ncbi:hypothetical protein EPK99_03410 [Neorhizobium lilium]|uniref:Uncharacterized protein n=1 Tax=Neorhizobium lilium TaxID=2503024 RepID=A0A3S3SIK7_9HYPH|nr:hypothetical protein [Neorhizobium lilium]RWX81369.1 hypothetical protein EPK99_03410 [Neorhizobium lilium]
MTDTILVTGATGKLGQHVVRRLIAIARIVADILKRPVESSSGGLPPGLEAFARRAIGEFIALISEGLAAPVTGTVETITGHPPRSVERFLARQLAAASTRTTSSSGEKTWH